MFGERFLHFEEPGNGETFSHLLGMYAVRKESALMLVRQAGLETLFLIGSGVLWPTCVRMGSTRLLLSSDKAIAGWSGATLHYGPLPLYMLRTAKIWFSLDPPPKAASLLMGDFSSLLGARMGSSQPLMLSVHCGTDDFFVFFPGGGKPVDQVVDVVTGELVSDPVLIAPLLETRCAALTVEHFPFRAESDAWLEYRAHRHFCDVCESLLRRYGDLTGRVMVQALVRTMNVYLESQDWPVEFWPSQVYDSLALASLDKTRSVYLQILTYMFGQMTHVVGDKLVRFMLTDWLNSLPKEMRAEVGQILPAG